MLGPEGPATNFGSHIDASHSRQPLVNSERLVRLEAKAVMRGMPKPYQHLLQFTEIGTKGTRERRPWDTSRRKGWGRRGGGPGGAREREGRGCEETGRGSKRWIGEADTEKNKEEPEKDTAKRQKDMKNGQWEGKKRTRAKNQNHLLACPILLTANVGA